MENSHISWTDHTFNPWIGCTKVSPGCVHCYAEARDQRFAGGAHWGNGAPRQRTSAANWKQPLKWNAAFQRLEDFMEGQKPRPRVFCASLADWLDDEVPIEWLVDMLDLIRRTPNLDWLLLSKRPQNWQGRIQAAFDYYGDGAEGRDAMLPFLDAWLSGAALENAWIGTTVEDQVRARERIRAVADIPATIRFLSCEPLLGPVDLYDALKVCWRIPGKYKHWSEAPASKVTWHRQALVLAGWEPSIHWVICGGESGAGARPMNPDWARALRDQCAAVDVAFHFKQWGGPDNKERGRLLDGVLHDALPRLSNNEAVQPSERQ